jgi:AbrB family looped-hinge helix DNA binding protein
MKHEHRLTAKGQVTIPKDIREALGLEPGNKVAFQLDRDGKAFILKADPDVGQSEKLDRVREVQAEFRRHDPLAGMDGLAFQEWVRESPEV